VQQTRQCPNCGTPAGFGMRFCGKCGTPLTLPQQMPSPPTYQQPLNYQQQYMTTGRTEALEYKHVECPQSWVNAILSQYSLFYWDLVATQVIVSKESHLERGGIFDSDTIYSVTTTERFATVDLKRRRDIPNIDIIRSVEHRYIEITGQLIHLGCSPLNNFTAPPPAKGIGCLGVFLYLLWIFPGVIYSQKIKKDNERTVLEYKRLIAELDGLLTQYRQYLNM